MTKHILKATIFINILLLLVSCASTSPTKSEASPVFAEDSVQYRSSDMSVGRSLEASPDNRMIAYSASLELSVRNTEETRSILAEQVRSNNGFIVRETENSITTRIPSENMDDFIDYAKRLGSVDRETKTGTDITDQYRDDVFRLNSLQNVRNRYLTLLERADSVTDILSIERELERVNWEIDRLEGRIKYAEASVAYSNVTVRFREKTKPGPLGWVFYGLYRGVRWLFVWN